MPPVSSWRQRSRFAAPTWHGQVLAGVRHLGIPPVRLQDPARVRVPVPDRPRTNRATEASVKPKGKGTVQALSGDGGDSIHPPASAASQMTP